MEKTIIIKNTILILFGIVSIFSIIIGILQIKKEHKRYVLQKADFTKKEKDLQQRFDACKTIEEKYNFIKENITDKDIEALNKDKKALEDDWYKVGEYLNNSFEKLKEQMDLACSTWKDV